MQENPEQILCRMLVLLAEAGLLGRPGFLGRTPLKHAAEPRDCPYRPRAPQGVGVRVRVEVRARVRVTSGVGLVWAEVQD